MVRADPAPRSGRQRTVILLVVASLAIVAGALVAAAPGPSPALAVPVIGAGGRTVSGWLPYWTMSAVVYDYAGLGAAADALRIMVYNRHMPGTRPGGVAPLPWTRDVLNYAVALVSPDRVELGVATYGFDWVATTTSAHSVRFRQARALQRRYDATVVWHDVSGEPSFRYRAHGVRHVVWYSDARSIRIRAALAADYGLRAITLWYLDGEAPAAW